MAKELKNLDDSPPEGIKVGVNDDDFSTIFADIEGPGMLCLLYIFQFLRHDTCSNFSSSTLQLGLLMRMGYSAWSWFWHMISLIPHPKVCLNIAMFSSFTSVTCFVVLVSGFFLCFNQLVLYWSRFKSLSWIFPVYFVVGTFFHFLLIKIGQVTLLSGIPWFYMNSPAVD